MSQSIAVSAASVYERQQALAGARQQYRDACNSLQRDWDRQSAGNRIGPLGSVQDSKYVRPYAVTAEELAAEVASLQAQVGGVVYRIAEYKLDDFEASIAKLNKRASKLGVEGVAVNVTDERDTVVQTNPETKVEFASHFVFVTVDGQTPKLNGWRFVASLDYVGAQGLDDKDGNAAAIIRRVPGQDDVDLEAYRYGENRCDHCDLIRRRNVTYIVAHEDGAVKQVGSDCVADFLGGANPHGIAKWAELLWAFDEGAGDFGSSGSEQEGECNPVSYSLLSFVTAATASIRVSGYVSRYTYGEFNYDNTADRALDALRSREKAAQLGAIAEDGEKASEAINWVREDLAKRDRLGEFEHNLIAATASQWLGRKTEGFVGYLPVAYQRELERRERAKIAGQSVHVGSIGDRVKLTLKAVFSRGFEGTYGVRYLNKLVDADGNSFVWWGARGLESGKCYAGTATIKAHGTDEYNEGAATTEIRNFRSKEAAALPEAAGEVEVVATAEERELLAAERRRQQEEREERDAALRRAEHEAEIDALRATYNDLSWQLNLGGHLRLDGEERQRCEGRLADVTRQINGLEGLLRWVDQKKGAATH